MSKMASNSMRVTNYVKILEKVGIHAMIENYDII